MFDLKMANRLPRRKADAIIVVSYLVAEENPNRLTRMSEETMREAIRLFNVGLAKRLIFTAAHKTAELEKEIKLRMAMEAGILRDQVSVIMLAANTYEEAVRMRELVEKTGLESLLLVAEERHMQRAFRIFERTLAGTGVELYRRSIRVEYEPEYYAEPPSIWKMLKQFRSRYLVVRLFAEWALNLFLPFLVRRRG